MARLIDADEFLERLCDRDCDIVPQYSEDGYSIERIEETLNATPTVDAVQVVRCKDCIHRDAEDNYRYCRLAPFTVEDNCFCSHGQTAEEAEAEYDELRYSWARDEYEPPIY